MHLVAGQGVVFARVYLDVRFLEVELGERIFVEKNRTAADEITQMHLEGRGVHRHEHLRLVPRSMDVVRAEIELKATDTGKGSRGSADFRRKVGESADVVAEEGRIMRKQRSGNLHTVAGVAGESDDDMFDVFDLGRCGSAGCLGCHGLRSFLGRSIGRIQSNLAGN